jgi:hypothetical protein
MIPARPLLDSGAAPAGWPMAAWYLADEPDANGMTPETLLALDKSVRSWSPAVPTAFVLGDGRAAAKYSAAGSVMMVDWYPVPHLPLSSAGDQVRRAVEAAGGKPVWAVLQAMDWKDYPQKDPKKPRIGRFPNIEELRFMSYDAVLQGAGGLWYYTFTRPDGQDLTHAPELWFALTWVVRELAQMKPVFEGGVRAEPPFKPEPGDLQARAWRWRGRRYVVVVNRGGDAAAKLPEELLDVRWRPLFENRRDVRQLLDAKDGVFRLRPHQVLVLEGPG